MAERDEDQPSSRSPGTRRAVACRSRRACSRSCQACSRAWRSAAGACLRRRCRRRRARTRRPRRRAAASAAAAAATRPENFRSATAPAPRTRRTRARAAQARGTRHCNSTCVTLVAGIVAVVAAARRGAASRRRCRCFRRRRQRARDSERALGRTHHRRDSRPTTTSCCSPRTRRASTTATARSTRIDRGRARADQRRADRRVRVDAAWTRDRPRRPTRFEDRPEGIARDRWDVAIETADGTALVECGAIRERVSQELARAVFDAVKSGTNRRRTAECDASTTTRSPARPRDDSRRAPSRTADRTAG